jgi:AraC-like DNA-binding protein
MMTDTTPANTAMAPSEPQIHRGRGGPGSAEATAWRARTGGWKRLYGGLDDLGVTLESQEFQSPLPFEWSRGFHPCNLELCLNVTEAAMEVGYSGLSHFSQSFCQVMGCCPGLYPCTPSPGRRP